MEISCLTNLFHKTILSTCIIEYDFVTDIPIVQVLQSQYSVNIGSSRTLECTVTANPTHTNVYWQRNVAGQLTQITIDNVKYSGSTVGNPSLTVNNAENNDEGFYICFATNSVGTGQSANTYLDVIGSKCVNNYQFNLYFLLGSDKGAWKGYSFISPFV